MKGQSGLHLAVIEITERCNLRCTHCYGKFDKAKKLSNTADISWNDIDLITQELVIAGCSYATISGGEPLLAAPKAFSLAHQLRSKGIRTILTTNGLLLDQFELETLGCFDHIQISLDGPHGVHNYIRGKGTFEKTLPQIRRLRKSGLSVSVMMTLSSQNYVYLNDMESLCNNEDVKLAVERMTPVGRGSTIVSLNRQQWEKVVERVLSGKIECTDPICRLAKQIQCNEKLDGLGGCTAGIAAIAITSQLDVLPCARLRCWSGNLKKHKLLDIWERSDIFRALRERTNLKGKCSRCKYLWQCGGCRVHAFAIHSNIYAEDPLCLF